VINILGMVFSTFGFTFNDFVIQNICLECNRWLHKSYAKSC